MVFSRKPNFFESAAVFSAIATCLVLPLSSPLLSLFSILTVVFWLCSGKIKEIPSLFRSNPIVFLSILLFTFFIVGMFYSSAEIQYALSILKKYREIIFIPIIISLLKDNPTGRKNCEYGFISGCILLMLISYSMYFSIVPMAKYGYSVIYHITHSFFMATLAFWALHKMIDSRQYRYFWIIIFLLSLINLFYIAPGRTGMLVFFFLMLLFLVQRLSLLQQMVGMFVLTLLLSVTFLTSENFSSRSSEALKEVQEYQYGAARTSMGMRLDWWINCVGMIKEKPLFGYGTGSFLNEHDKWIEGTKIQPTDNPHNEYLFIGVQLGVVGLVLFLMLFAAQIIYSSKLEKSDRLFVQGVVVAMAVGCIMNSFLFDSHQGHFWAFLVGVYFSAYPQKHLPV
jgi:O-antigen ligase